MTLSTEEDFKLARDKFIAERRVGNQDESTAYQASEFTRIWVREKEVLPLIRTIENMMEEWSPKQLNLSAEEWKLKIQTAKQIVQEMKARIGDYGKKDNESV